MGIVRVHITQLQVYRDLILRSFENTPNPRDLGGQSPINYLFFSLALFEKQIYTASCNN